MSLRGLIKRTLLSRDMDRQVDNIAKPVGSLGYDPWGFNAESASVGLSLVHHLYHRYFRVQADGVDQVPAQGPVLLVANHSGQLPLDGVLVGFALATREHAPRMPRAMIERFFPTVPYLGNLLNQLGATLGDPTNCAKMLANGEAIIVFPEGVRGSGKLYRDRYQLKRFGSGFMHLAMEYQATVIPVGVVGCEETIPAFANITPLARMLGIPYAPLAAPVVLPARVILKFGAPMHFSHEELSEAGIAERVDRVKGAISDLIDEGLSERKRLF
ncbi:MAG: lysophospholipid acyltransferase family protein [Oleiphilaceae bacterium]|nr:lysophospholipid acyltransferase family protein [Oleiphilaceae bacterium]